MVLNFTNAWCKETAHPSYQAKWSKENPSAGQCAVTALIAQELIGGDIYSCKVGRCSHFVNMVDGKVKDFTAAQFGDPSNVKYVEGSFKKRTRASLLKNKDVKERYELLNSRMKAGVI